MSTLQQALYDAGLVDVKPMMEAPEHWRPQYVRDAAQVEVDDAVDRGRRYYLGFDLWQAEQYDACLAMLRELA